MPNKKTTSTIIAHKMATAYIDKLCQSELDSAQRIYRLYRAANCNYPKELASFLNVSPATISKAKKSGNIPADWLIVILRVKNVHPEWILTGNGPMYVLDHMQHENGHTFTEHMEDKAALQRLSSYALTEELLRRIAITYEEQSN